MSLRFSFLLLLPVVIGCKGGGDTDDDTGDTGDGPDYDPGCITIDGGGGYAWLQDALTVAEAGSTIELCAGDYEESVQIDKAITITGAGIGSTRWVGPTNEDPFTVVAAGDAAISGMSVTSTKSAFTVQEGSLSLTDVHVEEVGTYGLKVIAGSVEATRLQIDGGPWGGVLVEDGHLELADSTLVGATSFAVLFEGSTGDLVGNTLSAVHYTGDGTTLDDGFGVGLTDVSSVTLADNEITGNEMGGVYADRSVLAMSGDLVAENYLGVWIENSSADLVFTTLEDTHQYGLVVLSSDEVTLTGTDILTDAEESAQNTEDYDGSFGILGIDSDLDITDGTISGNNGAGIYLATQNTSSVALTMDGTLVDDNQRWGIYVSEGAVDLTDVTVSHTRDHELCVDGSSWSCNMAVAAWVSDISVSGGEVSDNDSVGLIGLLGSVSVTDATIARNGVYGLWTQDAALSVTGTLFEAGVEAGAYINTSNALFDGVTFQNGSATWTYGYTSGKDYYETVYHYEAQDMFVNDSTVTITGSTFQDGEEGIYAGYSQVTVSDTTFTRYNDDPLYHYDYDGVGFLKLERVTLEDIGGNAVYCSYGSVDLDRVAIHTTRGSQYRYDYYTNGKLDSTTEGSYSPDEAVYAYQCAATLEDVSFRDVRDVPFYASSSSVEMDGVSIEDAGAEMSYARGLIDLSYWSTTPDVWIHDVTIDGVHNGHGIEIEGSSSYPKGLVEVAGVEIGLDDEATGDVEIGLSLSQLDSVSLSGVHVGASNGHALYLDDLGEVSVVGLVIDGAGDDGLHVEDTTGLTVDGLDIASATGDGLELDSTTATITGATKTETGAITDAGACGVRAIESTLGLSGVTITDPAASGLCLEGGTYELAGSTVSGAGEYGMECSESPTLTTCPDSLDGDLGDQSECEGCTY